MENVSGVISRMRNAGIAVSREPKSIRTIC
jgi:hypothetical protein